MNEEITKIEKAYGSCRKCYGKGYSSELTAISWGADFEVDKPGSETQSNMILCSCDRGEQLEKIVAYLREQGRREERSVIKDMQFSTPQTKYKTVFERIAFETGYRSALSFIHSILDRRNEKKL
jgi:hypothetical protein